jgi:hypothetical protein
MKPKTPVADLRGDLDKFVYDLGDLPIHASAQRSRWSQLPARLHQTLRQLPLGWIRSNLRTRVTEPNSVHTIRPLIFRRPTFLGPSLR